ncbi:MAG: hypothetical protein Q9224_006599 [Gallowayella concinna]
MKQTAQSHDRQEEMPLPLTRPNLLALIEEKQQAQTFPPPYEAMAYPAPSAEKPSTTGKSKQRAKSATSESDIDAILEFYNIHLDRNLGHLGPDSKDSTRATSNT